MTGRYSLVIDRQRHLKWRWLDPLEQILMVLCGVALAGFTTTVFFDVVTRSLGHPVLWVQEVTTTFFVYGIFIGTAAAARRNDHLYLSAIADAMSGHSRLAVETFPRLVVLGAAGCMVYFGYLNFRQGWFLGGVVRGSNLVRPLERHVFEHVGQTSLAHGILD